MFAHRDIATSFNQSLSCVFPTLNDSGMEDLVGLLLLNRDVCLISVQ
jgi:hypothetical protein